MRFTSWTFDGDIEEATKWLPYAIGLLQTRYKHGVSRNVNSPAEGVTITTESTTGRIHISANIGGYMESGFLDVLNTAIGNENTYKPAIIRFNSFVTEKSELLINASENRVVIDGDESLAVGCSTKLESIDVSSESTSYHFDSDPAAFCDPTAIRNKKLCQMHVPPGVYTGKMRLMVQAIYGSKRKDYSYATESLGFDNLVLNGVSLGIAIPTAGLYTAPDGSYWLIKIGSNVTYQRMKISGAYQAAIDDESLSEAYALGRLVPTGLVETMADSSLTTALNGMSPIVYGWKFNHAGDEASIVVYKTASISGKNSAGSIVTATGIETRLLTVKIEWDEENSIPKFTSVTVVATGQHLPYSQTKTFYPAKILDQEVMKCLVVDINSHDIYANLEAPIYCIYDELDVLTPITVKNSKFTSKSADSSGVVQSYVIGQPVMDWKDPGKTSIYLPARKVWDAAGVVVGDDDYTRASTADNGQRQEVRFVYPEDIDGPYDMGLQTSTGPNVTTLRYGISFDNTVDTTVARWNLYALNKFEGYRTVVVIPWHDANAVIVATDWYETCDSYSNQAYQYGNDEGYYQFDYYTKVGHAWGSYAFSTYPNWGNARVSPPSFASITPTQEEYDQATKDSTYVRRGRFQTANLYSYRVNQQIYNDGANVGQGDPLPSLDITPLFDITAVDPYFYNPFSVRQSYSGATKYVFVGNIGGSVEWPSYTLASPVGWA